MDFKYLFSLMRTIRETIETAESFLSTFSNGNNTFNNEDVTRFHVARGDVSGDEPPRFDENAKEYELDPQYTADEMIDLIERTRLRKGAERNGEAAEIPLKGDEATVPKLIRGSISKRKDGRWMGRFYDKSGTQKAVYASSKLEVVDRLNTAIRVSDKEETDSVVSKKMTLKAWADIWLETYKKPKVKIGTFENIESVYRLHIIPFVGKKEVGRITALDVEKMLNKIASPSIKERAHYYLSACLADLVRNRAIKENVCAFIKKPKKESPAEKDAHTREEMETFFTKLAEFSKPYARFARFLAATGLRKGEALALLWSDIDFTKATISITKAYDGKEEGISTTKTPQSVRTLPLFDDARAALDEFKVRKGEIFDDVAKKSASSMFNYYAMRCGIPSLTLHGLRHHFASMCRENGVDDLVVQRWMGHKKGAMTIHYTHIGNGYEAEQARKMAKKAKS